MILHYYELRKKQSKEGREGKGVEKEGERERKKKKKKEESNEENKEASFLSQQDEVLKADSQKFSLQSSTC